MKKRLLSLLLAVLVLCAAALPVSAAGLGFTDNASIQHQQAVAALSADGIINGYTDGSFGPERTLTRAEACAILTRLVGGAASGTADFLDVPAGHWASGYIAFCAAQGYVSGYGNGYFGPSDILTGSAWSKMLLGALGYDAASTGMLGSSWELGVSILASSEDLYDGIDNFDPSLPVSRDNACQIAYNSVYDPTPAEPATPQNPEGTLAALSYSFSNSRQGFNYPAIYRIPLERFQLIYGSTELARQLYNACGVWGGNCFGMSGTTGMFYQNDNSISASNFNASATVPGALTITDQNAVWGLTLREYIEAIQVAQFAEPIQYAMYKNTDDLSSLVTAVQRFQYSGYDPMIIGVTGPEGGHALVGYAVEGNQILVYDCNYPNETRAITLTTGSSGDYIGWSYDITSTIHWSNQRDGSITYVPYSEYYQIWQSRQGAWNTTDMVILTTEDDLTVQDAQGGFVAQIRDGAVTAHKEGVYPVVDTGILVDEPWSQPETVSVWMPVESYTISAAQAGEVTVSLTNVEQSASITTNASTMTLFVDDSSHTRTVSVDASQAGSTYSITVRTTFDEAGQELTASGIVPQSGIVAGKQNGTLVTNGCDNVLVDGSPVTGPSTPTAGGSTITVSTMDELKAALGSNKTILLEPGTYTTVEELYMYSYENLTIRGNGAPGAVKLISSDGWGQLFWIASCNNVTIDNIDFDGNANAGDSFSLSCVYISNCENITIQNCDISNNGDAGISGVCSSILVEQTVIHDCGSDKSSNSTSGAGFWGCDATLNHCTFRNNGTSYVIGSFADAGDPMEPHWTYSKVVANQCTFQNNAGSRNASVDSGCTYVENNG